MIKTDFEGFMERSRDLIEAYPDSTKVGMKYRTKNTRAVLVLKTYDPVSGCIIKFKTSRAADVSRSIGALQKLGRLIKGWPPVMEEPENIQTSGMESITTTKASTKTSGRSNKKKKK